MADPEHWQQIVLFGAIFSFFVLAIAALAATRIKADSKKCDKK